MNDGPSPIPHKSHFKMGEICSMTGIKPYVLRYWESEFPEIRPVISSSGQKLYEHRDIEVISFIKDLLQKKNMTVEQAKGEVKLNAVHFDGKKFLKNISALAQDGEEEGKVLLPVIKKKLGDILTITRSVKERHSWQ